jgi:hypothetical protein
LTVKAVLEVGAGLALLAIPSLATSLLLGARSTNPSVPVVGRIAGAALLAIGIACWLARPESASRAAFGLVVGLFFFDACVVAILLLAHFHSGFTGIGIWSAIANHSGLGLWSVFCISRARPEMAAR